MGLTYFKRFRMEIDLLQTPIGKIDLLRDYRLVGWDESLVDAHADAKFQSFSAEMDANVFPCLGDRDGCRKLMREISSREGFVREATWLLEYDDPIRRITEHCGTVQGMRDSTGCGAIQNLGISPSHRSRGLGTVLMFAALRGFHRAGLQRVFLEVTAQNLGAVQLYARLGFRCTRTLYKAAEVVYA